jgi:hypothetical protein
VDWYKVTNVSEVLTASIIRAIALIMEAVRATYKAAILFNDAAATQRS